MSKKHDDLVKRLNVRMVNKNPNRNYILYYIDNDESAPLFTSKDRIKLENKKDKLLLDELNRIKNFINKNKENANRYFTKIANWLNENQEALLENRLIATYTLESCNNRPLPSNIRQDFIEKIRNGHLTYLYTIDDYLDKDKIKIKRPK